MEHTALPCAEPHFYILAQAGSAKIRRHPTRTELAVSIRDMTLMAMTMHFANCYAVFGAHFCTCWSMDSNSCAVTDCVLVDAIELYNVPPFPLNSGATKVAVNPLRVYPCLSFVFLGAQAHSGFTQAATSSGESHPLDVLSWSVRFESL